MRKLALGLIAATFATSAAMAQTPLSFADVDTDGDGRLSFTELQAVWPNLTQEEFASVDVEGAGSITPDQLNLLQGSSVPAPGEAAPAPAPMEAVPAPMDAAPVPMDAPAAGAETWDAPAMDAPVDEAPEGPAESIYGN